MISHTFVVQFKGVVVKGDKIRHVGKQIRVRAEDSHRAVDEARKQVQKDAKLASAFYPSYRIASIIE